ncbi:SDR family NAD(P)-dependent oxidoreductase [Paenibacillus dokdonensis]|uniref:SDR family NAD(P)-dependent oxidoreductase n=1 Tax=Paenibacillus dokdonensis TaxID=2567944 RepID=UPI0010A7746B|nr:SDR family NAD(P)-dependent oxidoreductase [Paenibacillus dokdonensis]
MTQVVLITEAQHPWSIALCRYFAMHQWTVIACSPESIGLNFTGTEQIHTVTLDPRSKDSVQAAAAHVQRITDRIDLIVSQTVSTGDGEIAGIASMSPAGLLDSFNGNALGAIRVVEAFLPIMHQGLKRIALLTDPKGSLGLSLSGSSIAYSMSKAALHMAYTMMHGDLSREGYTFRLYAPATEVDMNLSAEAAFRYFTRSREDEERMVLLNEAGAEVPL